MCESLTLITFQIEESAKKAVEGANTGSAAIKLYNKWHKLLTPESASESSFDSTHAQVSGTDESPGEVREKKGLLHKVKNHIRGKGKSELVSTALCVCVCVCGHSYCS